MKERYNTSEVLKQRKQLIWNLKNPASPLSLYNSIFRENELKIIIQYNLKIVDYLDVTFNLTDSSDRPFSETNNETNLYINNRTTLLLSLSSYLYL